MTSEKLTKEQLTFLEECNLEFLERYTDSDLEYKKIYDLGIPSPPIMYPWYGKIPFGSRDRGRGGRHNDYRNRNQYYRNDDSSNRNREYRYGERAGSSYNNHNRERFSDSYGDSNRDSEPRNRFRPY